MNYVTLVTKVYLGEYIRYLDPQQPQSNYFLYILEFIATYKKNLIYPVRLTIAPWKWMAPSPICLTDGSVRWTFERHPFLTAKGNDGMKSGSCTLKPTIRQYSRRATIDFFDLSRFKYERKKIEIRLWSILTIFCHQNMSHLAY